MPALKGTFPIFDLTAQSADINSETFRNPLDGNPDLWVMWTTSNSSTLDLDIIIQVPRFDDDAVFEDLWSLTANETTDRTSAIYLGKHFMSTPDVNLDNGEIINRRGMVVVPPVWRIRLDFVAGSTDIVMRGMLVPKWTTTHSRILLPNE